MRMQEDNYNIIILGTSPLAITEAIWHKRQGKTVLNIDEKDVAGGAWRTVKHDGFPEVEIGCHIWEIERGSTNFLSKFFQLDLVPLSPQPKIVKKYFTIPYDFKMNLTTTKFILSKVLRVQFKELKHGLNSPARAFPIKPRTYLYPKGGAIDVHSRLLEKIKSEDLNIRLTAKVKSIEVLKDQTVIHLTSGEQFSCDLLVLTSLSTMDEIKFVDGTHLKPQTTQFDYIHVHLLMKTTIPRKFSYERWMDDEIIHRVSNMTSHVTKKILPTEELICVGIHADKYHSTDQQVILNEVIGRLKKRKLIEENADLIQSEFNAYPSYYTDPNHLTEINARSQGRIQVLRSTNFTYSFYNQKTRYRELLTSDTQQA